MKKFITKARNTILSLQFFANPAHVIYDNFVLENKMTDITNTQLEVRSLMTMDYSLTETAGMKKTINKYTYTGSVEKLAKGAKNTDSAKGKATLVGTDYTVNRYQQTFVYNDMEVMKDPYMLDVLTKGAADTMTNQIKSEYFEELGKITNNTTWPKSELLKYDHIVDALAVIDQEIEEGMFVIMGNTQRKEIRKDTDYKASKQGEILYTGQFGTVAGLPVLFSKLVPADTVYITTKDAVKFFVKKDGSVEQDRDVETKDNTVVYDRYGVIALVDDTKSIKMTKATA
ncbi:hypothetical protein QTL86_11155 [Cellulosilyticum sp. ST5]|uniref:hypothetical protein n=1 Tax=Cellulosilyticum sp. ST5 TaxID=3055805 RepID=UPI003977D57A